MKEDIKDVIDRVRGRMGLSREQFAEYIMLVSRSTLYNWIAGEAMPEAKANALKAMDEGVERRVPTWVMKKLREENALKPKGRRVSFELTEKGKKAIKA